MTRLPLELVLSRACFAAPCHWEASANEIRNPRSHALRRASARRPSSRSRRRRSWRKRRRSRRPSRRDRRHVEHHRDAAAADRHGRRRASPSRKSSCAAIRASPTLLRTQPGIAVSNSGGSGKNTVVRIRGEEHYRTLLMIDGVKALDTERAAGRSELRLAADDERSRARRGAARTAGLHLRRRRRRRRQRASRKRGAGDLGGQLGLEYGDYSTRKIDGALSGGGDARRLLSCRRPISQTDGFNAQTADTVLRDDDGDDNTTMHAKFGWNVTRQPALAARRRATSMPRPRTTAASHRRRS